MLARKALAGTAGAPKVYVEDVFSTYLYTGTGSSQTITNNIDISGKGGLVWIKGRSGATGHRFTDTARGVTKSLESNSSNAEATESTGLTAFSGTGFTIGADADYNTNAATYCSWTFRKAEKFFDVVTFTQSGTSGYQTINHNLGSVPGVIIIKGVGQADGWFVYHRSIPTQVTYLNQTNAAANFTLSNSVTSTTFNFNLTDFGFGNGATYVAYLFAHDAGGFGDAGSDNVISCGSFVGSSSSAVTVTLGYEPQYILMKDSSGAGSWWLWDTMRGLVVDGGSGTGDKYLFANASSAEAGTYGIDPTSTGFIASAGWANGNTYIYIAIRRGPMKTPTTGTSVFLPSTAGATTPFSVGFVPDMGWFRDKSITNNTTAVVRLTGAQRLRTNLTNAESLGGAIGWDANTNFWYQNDTGGNLINWLFRRAPGFFDVVCYTGNGSTQNVSHNLGVAPELMIIKQRSGTNGWPVYSSGTGNTQFAYLNQTSAFDTNSSAWNNTSPTSSVFTVGSGSLMNTNAATYVAYLFASLSGVSKIGTYTGNGSSVTVTTNFQPRFILVKRTDSTGDWIVSDSARGLVAGNDPYLELNTQDAEVTNEDWVDISSTSFTVNQTTNNANVNTGTYLYLAIS